MAYIQSLRTRIAGTSKLTYLFIVVALWLIIASYLWFHIVYQSPEQVFKGMLRNNFATTSYAKSTAGVQNGLQSDEVMQLQLGGEGVVQGVTKLSQGNDKVTTNTIAAGQKSYVQYADIKTNRTGKDGKPLAFDKVIGVWAATDTQAPGTSQAVSQMMLGLIPLGNVSPRDRAALLDKIAKTKAITADYKTVKKEQKNGRLVYVYTAKIQPVPYLQVLKQFGKAAGLEDQVASLNPDDYKDTPATTVELTVDARSRQLIALTPPGQASGDEVYSGYGIQKAVKLPTKTITTDELQQRLNIQ